MRKLRLLLLAAVFVATMAAVPTASAQGVELMSESSGQHCPAVSLQGSQATGGCQFHLGSVGQGMRLEAFGSLVSDCFFESDTALDEDGHGYIYNQSLFGASCTTPPCGSPFVDEWEVEVGEELSLDPLEIAMCVQSSILGTINCHFIVDGGWASFHQGFFSADRSPCESGLSFVHVTMDMATESSDIEVLH